MTQRRTVVVGAGIAGLAAAHELAAAGDDVLVLEGRAVGRRQAPPRRGRRGDRRRRRRGDAQPPPRGASTWPAPLGLPIVHPATTSSRIWTRGALRPLPALADGRARRPRRAGRVRRAVRGGPGPGPRRASLPPARSTRTCPSARSSPTGSATRSSTGWSSRCSAGCTPATPRSLSARADGAAAGGAARPRAGRWCGPPRPCRPPPTSRSSPAWRAAWPRCPSALAGDGRLHGPDRHDRPRAAPYPDGFELVVGPTAAPEVLTADRGRAGHPGRAHRPAARRPRPGRGRRAGGDRVRLDGRGHAGLPRSPTWRGRRACATGPASWCRRSTAAPIKAATFSLAKWGWVRDGRGRRDVVLLRTSSAGTARRPRSSATTTSWSRSRSPTSPTRSGSAAAPGRQPRAALGRRAAAVRRRPPRPGRPDPRGRRPVPGLAVCGAAYDGVGIPAVHRLGPEGGRRPCDPGRGTMRGMSTQAARTRELNDSIRYTMWSVFRLEHLIGDADRTAEAARGRGAVREARRERRRGARDVRRGRPARRRRRDGLVARRDLRAAAGRLQPRSGARRSAAASRRSGRRWRCTARRSSTRATSRRSSPTRSRGARLRLPVRAVLRVVPPRGLRAPPDARRARPDGARLPRRPRQHGGQLRARRLRVDAGLRGRRAAPDRRPDAAPARPPRPAGTCARRCRSTPVPAPTSRTSSPACPDRRKNARLGAQERTARPATTRTARRARTRTSTRQN